MFKFLKSIDWLGLFLYGAFGTLLDIGGVGVMAQPFIFFALLGILMFVDIRAHNKGLDAGADMVKEVWGIK